MPAIKGRKKKTTKKKDTSTKKGRGGKATSKGKGVSAVKKLLGGLRMSGGGGSPSKNNPLIAGPQKGLRRTSKLQ